MNQSYAPIVETTRDPIVESTHFGALAVVTSEGDLIAHLGDPYNITYLRSSAKPLQALPFIEREGHKRFNFSASQIALMCASHSGTDSHVTELKDMLAKIGCDETCLQCGIHPPIDEKTYHKMIRNEEPLTPHRHNCSGKHTGMLALARLLNQPIDHYLALEHPAQQLILQTVSEMSDVEVDDIIIGIDGCSAPNFAIPLYNAALAYARLSDPRNLPPARRVACQAIFNAMSKNPFMVAGPERFDTIFMTIMQGRAISKGGAEGYLCIGLKPDSKTNPDYGIGIAIKISDGDPKGRARASTAIQLLKELNLLEAEQLQKFSGLGPRVPIYNYRELHTGEIRPCFSLNERTK